MLMQLLAYGAQDYYLTSNMTHMTQRGFNYGNLRLNDHLKKKIGLNKLKNLFYCWKFKAKLVEWMWRARQRIAQREWHPDRIKERLEACGGDLEALFFLI